MGLIDILLGIFMFILFIVCVGAMYCAVSYIELKSMIHECNSDMGEGNWTFIHQSKFPYDQYTCKSYKQECYVTSSIQTMSSKQWFENGKEVTCE